MVKLILKLFLVFSPKLYLTSKASLARNLASALLLLFGLLPGVASGQTTISWESVGEPGFSMSSAEDVTMAVAPDGTAYVAFIDNVGATYDATVMKFNGSNWELVGARGFTPGRAYNLSLVLDNQGTPYVAFRDSYIGNKATVMKFNGSSWDMVGQRGFTYGSTNFVSLAIDGDGNPYVAIQDNTLAYRVTVLKFNGTTWVAQGKEGFSAGQASTPKIAIGPKNTPYVVFRDGSSTGSNRATVMKLNGTNWENVGPAAFSGGYTVYPQIAISADGIPYVAFIDDITDKAAVMKFNGTSWEVVGQRGFSVGLAYYLTLAIDSHGKPAVGYSDSELSKKTSVMQFNGTQWEAVGIPAFSEDETLYSCLALHPAGTPYMAFVDVSQRSRVTVMRYGTPAAPGTSIAVQPTSASVCPGSSASFSVTANNAVFYQWQVLTTSWQNIVNNSIYSGTTTATLTVANTTDLHNMQYRCVVTGNSNSEAITQAVTLSAADVTKPTAVAKNIAVTLNANGTAEVTPDQVDDNSTDDCGIQTIALSRTVFNCENIGANSVILTVTDRSGNVSTATATVTVMKTPQTITFNALAAGTYGDAPLTLNAASTSGGAITYTIEGPATVNGNVLTITGAGEVKVTASQAGTACYSAAVRVTQIMQVAKKQLTVSADAKTRIYGEDNPSLTYVIAGFVNADTEANLDVAPAVTTDATITSNAGAYTITVAGGNDDNYSFAYQTSTLTIEQAPATITLAGLEQPEIGEPRVVTATTMPEGLTVSITYNGQAEAPILKGTYEVIATINEQNYKGSSAAVLIIQAPTGLGEDLKELKGVSLHPNPTKDGKLYLELYNTVINNSLLVEVYSASGRLVSSMHIKGTSPSEIDLSSYAAGLYLVRVVNGMEVKTIRVHKQ